MISLMCGVLNKCKLKQKQNKKQVHRCREQIGDCQRHGLGIGETRELLF